MGRAGAGELSEHMRNTMPHFITQDKKDFPPRLNYGSITSSTIPRSINHRELHGEWQSGLTAHISSGRLWHRVCSNSEQRKPWENKKAVSTVRYADRLAAVE
jgi:hypothetical protein